MIASIDASVVEWVAEHRVATLNGFFVALGTVEKLGAIWVLLAVAIAVASRRGIVGGAVLVALTALTTFLADSASFGVKDLVHRTRPFDAHPQIHPLYTVHSSSFPAGHAATAFAGATLLSYVVPRAIPLFAALAFAVGFSRVYVGVHYPSDVLVGAAIGVLVGAAVIAALLLVERWKPRAVAVPRRRRAAHAS
jgi:undecaprenyl-diphosphatase